MPVDTCQHRLHMHLHPPRFRWPSLIPVPGRQVSIYCRPTPPPASRRQRCHNRSLHQRLQDPQRQNHLRDHHRTPNMSILSPIHRKHRHTQLELAEWNGILVLKSVPGRSHGLGGGVGVGCLAFRLAHGYFRQCIAASCV